MTRRKILKRPAIPPANERRSMRQPYAALTRVHWQNRNSNERHESNELPWVSSPPSDGERDQGRRVPFIGRRILQTRWSASSRRRLRLHEFADLGREFRGRYSQCQFLGAAN